ncbi:hypothetical protein LCGC14_2605240 [marine sediment metagenome]|uniref:Uncharacterized protein n=1 Tax=marine sediment metagenome TaxID=412755 RepID=A0A0F9AVA7_9ZZZZ
MSDPQAAAPDPDNAAAVENPAKGGTVLTGAVEGADPSLTEGAPTELPHAWMNGLTTEQKADADLIKSVSKFEKGIPELVGSYAELEKKLSQAVSVPNEQATEEEKARYRKAIGVPEKSEDYKLGEVKLPEDLTIDEAMQKGFLETAHSLNLSGVQADKLYQWYMASMGKQIVDARLIVKTTEDQARSIVQKDLGAGYTEAEGHMTRLFAQFGTPEVAKLYRISGIGNHPEVIKMHMKMGKAIGDHKFVDGSRGEQTGAGVVGQRTDAQIAKVMYPDAE